MNSRRLMLDPSHWCRKPTAVGAGEPGPIAAVAVVKVG
jgi:hypothetical protein